MEHIQRTRKAVNLVEDTIKESAHLDFPVNTTIVVQSQNAVNSGMERTYVIEYFRD